MKKSTLTCLVLGCDRMRSQHAYCFHHKIRFERYGRFTVESRASKFWRSVNRAAPNGCWEWTGALARGYGMTALGERSISAHRLSWLLTRGEIPEGLQLDHLCRNRVCVNPAHLEPVTGKVNVLRGVGLSAINAAKTHCIHGHEFTPENTRVYQGRRHCRACARELMRRRRAS